MIETRSIQPGDVGFIYNSWLRTFKKSPTHVRVRNDIFYENHQQVIQKIFDSKLNDAIIAHLPNEPDIVIGYLVYSPGENLVHYCYVKGDFRKHGIATMLFKKANIDINTVTFTHWTKAAFYFCEKYPNMVYDPYRL